LQNQALRAELQRREGEKEGGFIDAVGKTVDILGKTALAAGAVTGAALAGRRLAPGRTTSATVDLSKFGEKVADVRRAAAARVAPPEVVPPSRPAPATAVERQRQAIETTIQARAERPQGIRQGNLQDMIKQVKVEDLGPTDYSISPEEQKGLLNYIENVAIPLEQKRLPSATDFLQQRLTGQKTDLPVARTPGTFQQFSREASGVAAAERLAQDPELLSLVKAQAAEELSEARSFQSKAQAEYRNLLSAEADEVIGTLRRETNTAQAAAESDFGPQSFLQSKGYVEADNLVDQHQARALGRIDQFANAANPAEDQATGRVKMALQRNEDVNLAAIEMAEDAVDSQIAKAAQGDPTVASVTDLDSAINQAASTLPDGLPVDQAEGLTRPITAQEQANLAKQEMIVRRQELEARGLRPGTVRFERALAEPFRTSEYTQMRGTGAVETALPAGPIRGTVEAVSASEYLPERSVLNVGPQAQVTSTAAGTSIRGAAPSYQTVPSKEETRQLFGTPEPLVPGAPAEMGPDFPGSARVRGVMPELEAGEQLSKQEIVYGALDRPVAPEAPGGSAGIGVYGIEPGYVPGAMSKATGEYSAAASRKPTYVPAWLQKREAATGFEALTTEQLASGAEKARGGRIKQAFESELGRREAAKEAVAFSEIARRAIIEGRDIPSAFKAYGVEVSPAQGPREAFGRTTQGVRSVSEIQEPKLRIASPEDWQKQQARRRGLI
jgi:hypothetical protein